MYIFSTGTSGLILILLPEKYSFLLSTMYNSKCCIANIVKFNMGKLKSCYKIKGQGG